MTFGLGQHRYLPNGEPITILSTTNNGQSNDLTVRYVYGHVDIMEKNVSDLLPTKRVLGT